MEILLIFFVIPIVIGAGIAPYEWRKGIKQMIDTDTMPAPHDRERAAHTQAERIRTEGIALQNPGTGHF